MLVRLSLPGKRIGDGGAAAIAPALPGIRSVDLRSNNIGDDGTVAIASALREAAATAMAVSRGGERKGGASALGLCVLESLSLAGNRIGDVGAAALGEVLEGGREDSRRGYDGQEEKFLDCPSAQQQSRGRLRYLGWLSVGGNPAISIDGKERLIRAGSNRRRPCRGDENDPPPMVVIV